MCNVASAVTKKKVHPEFRAMLLNLRSLTIEKLNDDGQPEGERPLGLGECELRFFCKVRTRVSRRRFPKEVMPETKSREPIRG